MAQQLFGWTPNPAAVAGVMATLPAPLFSSAGRHLIDDLQTNEPVLLYKFFREVVKSDPPKGPQLIGDCVSWGWSNLVNYIAALQIYLQLKKGLISQEEFDQASNNLQLYEACASEAVYGHCRVTVGGQRGSRSDGAVGAWAAKSVNMGTLSRKVVGAYSGQRAKDWGATGIPQKILDEAKALKDATGKDYAFESHKLGVVSMVKNFREAAAAIQNGKPIAVCSGQGFTMTRDNQGFCRASGSWAHCMLFMAVRYDRPGLCCSQSWGPNTPEGPVDLEQPDNTFWVEEKTVDRMLSEEDSFTGDTFDAYQAEDAFVEWKH